VIDDNAIRLIFRLPLENDVSLPELNLVGVIFAEFLTDTGADEVLVELSTLEHDPSH
jgi:hypothetical protein